MLRSGSFVGFRETIECITQPLFRPQRIRGYKQLTMKKHILLLALALVISTVASAQLLNVNGRVMNSFAAGVFNQQVALIINAGSPATTINDTVTTDSLGYFFKRTVCPWDGPRVQ